MPPFQRNVPLPFKFLLPENEAKNLLPKFDNNLKNFYDVTSQTFVAKS
jgi:hypothetical protein